MLREIHHLKELNDQKNREACSQSDQLKGLDCEINRTHARIEDTTRLVDARSADLRTKQLALEDTERELARVRDLNANLNADCANLRRSNECTAAENYDLRKEVEFTVGRNGDLAVGIKDTEIKLKEREDALFVTKKDIEGQRVLAGQAGAANADLSNEMTALEKHSSVLGVQNHDLTGELDRFCKTDEVLRR
jgi:chromosome segregation ATPase